MSQRTKILLFSICFLSIGVFYFLNRSNLMKTSVPEKVTPNLNISFSQIDPLISEIYCAVLSHPLVHTQKINIAKTNKLVLDQGSQKPFFCDAIVKGKSLPIFWSLPLKNLNGETLLSRGFFNDTGDMVFDKIYYNEREAVAYANVSEPHLGQIDSNHLLLNNQYKINAVDNKGLLDAIELCTNCKETPRSQGTFFAQQFSVAVEKEFFTLISSLWDSRESAAKCDFKVGLTQEDLINQQLHVKTNDKFDKIPYDSSLIDGWKSQEAKAVIPVVDCVYNDAATKWQCNSDKSGKNIVINKGEQCSTSKEKRFQDWCLFYYFGNKIYNQTDQRCMNIKLGNFGGINATVDIKYPTARGLLVTQRTLLLSNLSSSSEYHLELIRPAETKSGLIPCKTKFETNSIIYKYENNKLLIFQQKRFINRDFKPECQDTSDKNMVEVKTIYIGAEYEN